ncbi:AraC family transcriptional regulator, partial [Enterococcus faecalis]|nr:AraC family transcriptional regulator [Enterococcus faecalis]
NDELARFLNYPERMKKGIQTGRMRFEQSTYFVQAIANKELNISVVAVANPNQALASVNRVQEQFVLVFIAILFTGITAVVMLGLRSYRPIRKIENLVQEFHRDPKMTLHSMDDVHNTLAAFLVEHQELHQEVRLQTPHAREQVLRKLMSGRFRSEQE